jgi:hypothetical protein
LGRVDDVGESDRVLGQELERYFLRVQIVDAYDGEIGLPVLLIELLEATDRLPADGSPGPPYVEPDDLAAMVG